MSLFLNFDQKARFFKQKIPARAPQLEARSGKGSRRDVRKGVYAMKRHVLIDEINRRGKLSLPYIMPDERVCNLDAPKEKLLSRTLEKQSMMVRRMISKSKSYQDIKSIRHD